MKNATNGGIREMSVLLAPFSSVVSIRVQSSPSAPQFPAQNEIKIGYLCKPRRRLLGANTDPFEDNYQKSRNIS